MISRRNIRVKVMQTLYAAKSAVEQGKKDTPEDTLKKKIDQSRKLFSYLIYFLSEVALYAEINARQKASKHLPTSADLNVNTKIAGNSIIAKTRDNKSFEDACKDCHFDSITDQELIKKLYIKLINTEAYNEYISSTERDKKSEKKILELILNELILPNEEAISHLEEHFINWDDDAEMMQTLVMNYLGKQDGVRFDNILSSEKWEFARQLLRTVMEKEEYTLEMIKPKLKNWDAERIAALDLIILQMGVCELLYFETIPTKVTINEYIDIAKAYSTPQSGQFINGLLDNIHKELTAADKIVKKNFKK